MRNALEKVSLAQPDSAIDVERIIDVARVARHGVGCRERKAVSCTDDEVLKAVAPVENQHIVVLKHAGFGRDLFRRLLHNFYRDGGRVTLDRVALLVKFFC